MIVNKDRLIELLHHQDTRVRDASVRALERFFPKSDGVIQQLLESIEKYPDDCLSLAAGIKSFSPHRDDLRKILHLIRDIDKSRNDTSLSLYYHLTQGLLAFPSEVFDENQSVFAFNKDLSELYELGKNREQFKEQEPDYLWDELVRLCKRCQGRQIEGEDLQYGRLLIDALSRHGKEIRGKVIMLLGKEKPDNYHLEEFMVNLAGELKLNETVPYLFRILKDSDFMYTVHSACIKALGNIGTHEVVKEIANSFDLYPELRTAYAEILRYIPYNYSEDLTISLIKKEDDLTAKTFLACTLCDLFSLKGSDTITDMIRSKRYDPEVTTLVDDLIPMYVYHREAFEDLSVLEICEKEYTAELQENDPLFKIGQLLRDYLASHTIPDRGNKQKASSNNNAKKVISLKKARNKKKRKRKKKGK